MSFPIYSSYTDSGFAWLGEVPSHWSVRPLKYLVSLRSGGTPSKAREDFWDGSIPWASAKDLKGERISDTDDHISEAAISKGSVELNAVNSILILVRGMMLARAFPVVEALVPVAINQDLKAINPKADSVAGRFLAWTLRGTARESLDRCSEAGHGTKALRMEDWLTMPFPVPPVDEQHAIAAFLDRETAKIDALVEEQRRLIALLKEKRQAVISHTVTKGLNPNAPVKDSGVEWLGEVPSHRDIWRIKTILKGIKQGWSPQCDAEPVDSFDAWGVLKAGCVNGGHFNPAENKSLPSELKPLPELAVRAGDVLISRANTRDLVGSAALVESDYHRLLLSDKLYCLNVDRDQVDPGFLALYLQADAARGQIEVAATGASSSMLNIGQAVIREMPIAIPSLEEQWKILAYVKQRRVAFISLTSEASNAISILNERRAALISSAVTGKIDVCGSAKVLPFPFDRARARRLIAAEIIDRSAHQATFGRTKLQKLLFLAEAHANVNELAGRYVRMPYGPLDQDMIDEIEGAAADTGFAVDDPGNRKMVRYRPIAMRDRNRSELAEWLGDDRVAKLDKLITDFTDLDTHAAEAVATLYAVWNDALIDGETLSDDWIVNGFLTAWNKAKAENFDRHELLHWLGWMRHHGLVPTGAGPKTGIGGLFA